MGLRPDPKLTLTREQYYELELTRPLTDRPIGALTNPKRDAGAICSEMFTDDSEFQLRPKRGKK